MRITVFRIFAVLLCVFCSHAAPAMISLELTQGVHSALPIAVVPFKNESSIPTDLKTSAVIAQDFTHSGEFSVFTADQLPQKPQTVREIQWSRWRDFAAQYVVLGDITTLGADRYRVTFYLVNLYYASAATQKGPESIVLTKTYTVNYTQLRHVAHQISNDIYQYLFRLPGIFTSKIAYILVQPGRTPTQPQYHLVVSDYDGYNPRFAASSNQPMMSAAWSPDGTKIAFVSFQKTFPAIFVVDIQSGSLQQITQLAGVNGAPAWSPDGKRLAYVSSTSGAPKIYEIDLLGHAVKQLTDGYALDTEPCYMPNGKSIVFTSNRSGKPQIYQRFLDSGKIERLTFTGDYNTSANIAADGHTMTLLHQDKQGYNIAIQDLRNDHFKIVAHDHEDESPKFSPNGKLILYATQKNNKHTLAMVSSNGEIHVLLPASDGDVRSPSWTK